MTAVQVVKIGGAALADAGWLERFANHASTAFNGGRIIVHGGGPEISALSEQLGIEVQWNGGRRVTSAAALDVASLVLTGRINKRIVRGLQAAGVDAIGLSGEDAGLVHARVMQGGQLGRVGEVTAVRMSLLRSLLALGLVPVISPISLADDGGAVNINADEVATAIAQAISAVELLFLTDVPAVRGTAGALSSLSVPDARALVTGRIATGGMAVKLGAAINAVEQGIGRVRVGSLEMMNDSEAGTVIRREEELVCRS